MKEYSLVVLSNPTPGKEDEYNDWYNNQHLREVLAVPGFTSARRFKLNPNPDAPAPTHQYLAIYNAKTDDLPGALTEMQARVASGVIGMTDAIDVSNVSMQCYEAICPTQFSEDA